MEISGPIQLNLQCESEPCRNYYKSLQPLRLTNTASGHRDYFLQLLAPFSTTTYSTAYADASCEEQANGCCFNSFSSAPLPSNCARTDVEQNLKAHGNLGNMNIISLASS
jgi:hypothetical protein